MEQYSDKVLSYRGSFVPNDAKSTLVAFSVENALLTVGADIYEKTVKLLNHDFECDILNCYEYPEYLNKVLLKLDFESRYKIMKIIQQDLGQYVHMKEISDFLKVLDTALFDQY